MENLINATPESVGNKIIRGKYKDAWKLACGDYGTCTIIRGQREFKFDYSPIFWLEKDDQIIIQSYYFEHPSYQTIAKFDGKKIVVIGSANLRKC